MAQKGKFQAVDQLQPYAKSFRGNEPKSGNDPEAPAESASSAENPEKRDYPDLAVQPKEPGNPYNPRGTPWPWFAEDLSRENHTANFRLRRDVTAKLEVAARRAGMSKSELVEAALEEELRRIFRNENIPFD